MPAQVIPTKPNPLKQWRKDDMGDYVVSIDRSANNVPSIEGRIIRCPITTKWKYQWRTKQRWLLMVNNNFYGFWDTLHEAAERFDKDCVPVGGVDEDEVYCWHKISFGKGKYCTGCGGLIKK